MVNGESANNNNDSKKTADEQLDAQPASRTDSQHAKNRTDNGGREMAPEEGKEVNRRREKEEGGGGEKEDGHKHDSIVSTDRAGQPVGHEPGSWCNSSSRCTEYVGRASTT